MASFDYFIALDGNGLNGFEGFAGVARLRCDPDAGRYDVDVRYYDGLAGGHALQINPQGTIGYLGNLAQTLFFFDPRTLDEVKRFSTLRFHAPEVFYSSQTHVVWLGERSFVTVLGPDFYLFDLDDLEHPERLGAHGVTLPHAIKRSPSGRFLFYGAMDHDRHGYANQMGVFDLEARQARVVQLPATAWHLGVHPTRDVFYAPSQRCVPQDGEFNEYAIGHFKNYLYEIDGETATVTRHLSIPKELPTALTSDVIATESHVYYNACASNVVVRVDLETFSKVEFLDERPSTLKSLFHLREVAGNIVEGFARTDVPSHTHLLLKAFQATRYSAIDGSYGLAVSPDRRYMLTAHRGLNEVIVYRHPSLEIVKRVKFPPIRRFFPERFGLMSDTRLGFHHSQLIAAP